jgi:hypothetical protein
MVCKSQQFQGPGGPVQGGTRSSCASGSIRKKRYRSRPKNGTSSITDQSRFEITFNGRRSHIRKMAINATNSLMTPMISTSLSIGGLSTLLPAIAKSRHTRAAIFDKKRLVAEACGQPGLQKVINQAVEHPSPSLPHSQRWIPFRNRQS